MRRAPTAAVSTTPPMRPSSTARLSSAGQRRRTSARSASHTVAIAAFHRSAPATAIKASPRRRWYCHHSARSTAAGRSRAAVQPGQAAMTLASSSVTGSLRLARRQPASRTDRQLPLRLRDLYQAATTVPPAQTHPAPESTRPRPRVPATALDGLETLMPLDDLGQPQIVGPYSPTPNHMFRPLRTLGYRRGAASWCRCCTPS